VHSVCDNKIEVMHSGCPYKCESVYGVTVGVGGLCPGLPISETHLKYVEMDVDNFLHLLRNYQGR
jgi:hypothetical protein